MLPGADEVPDPTRMRTFAAGAANPVELQIGPERRSLLPRLRRRHHPPNHLHHANQPPTAVATANPTTGNAPLTVQFDGSGSSDPDRDPISYAWDLDADGAYDDSTATNPTYTYSSQGVYTAGLRVTDSRGGSDTDSVTISVGNPAPTATIDTPGAATTWKVGDVINFSGHATDAQDGTLPASALSWELILYHCPSNCHTHPIQTFAGVASGSLTAPDHEYPSYLELKLTATDSGGRTTPRPSGSTQGP